MNFYKCEMCGKEHSTKKKSMMCCIEYKLSYEFKMMYIKKYHNGEIKNILKHTTFTDELLDIATEPEKIVDWVKHLILSAIEIIPGGMQWNQVKIRSNGMISEYVMED